MKISELKRKLEYVLENNGDLEIALSIDTEAENVGGFPEEKPKVFTTSNIITSEEGLEDIEGNEAGFLFFIQNYQY